MRHFLTILGHEVRMLLVSPSTYIAAVAFFLLMGFTFTAILEQYSKAPQDVSPASVFFQLLLVPGDLHGAAPHDEVPGGGAPPRHDRDPPHLPRHHGGGGAREVRRGLPPLLLFWASSSGFFYILQAVRGRRPPDRPRPILGGYLFIAVSGLFFIAIGVFASSLSRNQSVAGIICVVILVGIILGGQYLASAPWLDREALLPLKDAVNYAQIAQHREDFTRGVVDMRELLFYVSGTVLALIFSILSVEAKLLHS